MKEKFMGRNTCFFKVYNGLDWLIRLSFRGNVAYDLEGDAPLWKPSDVPFDQIKQWLRESSHDEPTLTNWQYLLYLWNEVNLGISMEIDEFLSGAEDAFNKDYSRGRYLPATTPMPDYNADIQIER